MRYVFPMRLPKSTRSKSAVGRWRRAVCRRALLSWLFSSIILSSTTPVLGQTESSRPVSERGERGVVRLDVGGARPHDLLVLLDGETLYLPLLEATTHLGYDVRESSSGTVTVADDANQLLTVDSAGQILSARADVSISIDRESTFILYERVLYIRWDDLSRILDISGSWDRLHLLLRISSSERVPLIRQQQAERRRQIEWMTAGEPVLSSGFRFPRSLWGSPLIRWHLGYHSSLFSESPGDGLLDGRAGVTMPAFFGRLDVAVTARFDQRPDVPHRQSVNLAGWQWSWEQPGSRLLTTATIGQAYLGGTRVHGFSLSNRPLTPRRLLSIENVSGEATPGTPLALSHNGRVLAHTLTDSTGRYTFTMPVGFGTTVATVTSLTPGTRYSPRTITWSPPTTLTTAGAVRYDVRAGIASTRPVVLGEVEASYGLTSRVSLLGTATLEGGESSRTGSIGASLGALSWIDRTISLGTSIDLVSRSLSGSLSLGAPGAPRVHLSVDSLKSSESGALSVTSTLPLHPVHLSAGGRLYRNGREPDRLAAWSQVQVGLPKGWVRLLGRHRFDRADQIESSPADPTELGVDLFFYLLPWLPVEGTLRWSTPLHSAVQYGLAVSAYHHGGMRTELRGRGGGSLPPSLSLAIRVPIGQIDVRSHAQLAAGMVRVGTTFDGTAVVGLDGIRFADYAARGSCTVYLTGFDDVNRNGRRDDGEQDLGPVEAQVMIDARSYRSHQGQIRNIPAYRDITVEVDPFSFVSSGLFPVDARVHMTTPRGQVVHLAIPFAAGREVVGHIRLQADDTERPVSPSLLSALRAYLVTPEGRQIRGEVFSDGVLYFNGVCYGDYVLRFDRTELQRRGLCLVGEEPPVALRPDSGPLPTLSLRRCRE